MASSRASKSHSQACTDDAPGEVFNPKGVAEVALRELAADVWVHIYHCDPYTGFLNRLRRPEAVPGARRMLLKNSEIGGTRRNEA